MLFDNKQGWRGQSRRLVLVSKSSQPRIRRRKMRVTWELEHLIAPLQHVHPQVQKAGSLLGYIRCEAWCCLLPLSYWVAYNPIWLAPLQRSVCFPITNFFLLVKLIQAHCTLENHHLIATIIIKSFFFFLLNQLNTNMFYSYISKWV